MQLSHSPAPLPADEHQSHHETPDERAHDVLAQRDGVRTLARHSAAREDLEDAAEQPERRVLAVLRQGEDELAVEVIFRAAPRVPAQPFVGVPCEYVDRVSLPVEHRAVKFAPERID